MTKSELNTAAVASEIKSLSSLLFEIARNETEVDFYPVINNILVRIRKLDKANRNIYEELDNLFPNLQV